MFDLIANSADLLNVVKAIALAMLSILLAWGLFYGVIIIRDVLRIVKDLKEIVKETKEGVHLFKTKAESGAYLLKMLSQSVHKVADVVEEKMDKKKKAPAKNKNAKKKK